MSNAVNVVPVGLKEAALDSPTFRATFLHIVENVDGLERWLENYIKAITKLSGDTSGLESLFNNYFVQAALPTNISEAVLDHDYTVLALERYGDGAREFWSNAIRILKKMESNMVEPIRNFMQRDLRVFKDLRRQVEQSQKQLDGLQSRFSAQARTKEASSLREDAFLLYESRKTYLKASMDFAEMTPQLRTAVDKLLVKISSDQWEDMQIPRQSRSNAAQRNHEIERARSWSRDLEIGSEDFRAELTSARRHLEQSALIDAAPSRELDDYSAAFASFYGGVSIKELPNAGPEKQGWLNLRSTSGKPSRTIWSRKWFFVKNGLIGWSIPRYGAVQQSEAIGVLLCSIKPANGEERRFCFEIKTKDRTIVVQAETRPELIEWLGTFEFAKQRVLENPMDSTASADSQSHAFAIIPPIAPEFAAEGTDSNNIQNLEDTNNGSFDRSGTLPISGPEKAASFASRSSFDVATMRRGNIPERDPDSTREKIIQKFDLHRKPTLGLQQGGNTGSVPSSAIAAGGIASLISASHNVMPIGPGLVPPLDTPSFMPLKPQMSDLPSTSLAPVTLVNPPAPTNLSTTAIVVVSDRGFGRTDNEGPATLPNSVLANTWGSQDWGFLNVLDGDGKAILVNRGSSSTPQHNFESMIYAENDLSVDKPMSPLPVEQADKQEPSPSSLLGKLDHFDGRTSSTQLSEFPANYPVQLKTQNAQVRLLFPGMMSSGGNLLLVFQASWNLGSKRNFPGRVYVTSKMMYFYSNHLGLVLSSGVRLASISEITSAAGRECDFVYLHMSGLKNQDGIHRITIRVFLGSHRILQRRLEYLVELAKGPATVNMESIITNLIKIEQEERLGGEQRFSGPERDWMDENHPVSPDTGSWSDSRGFKTNLLLDQGRSRHAKLQQMKKDVSKFKLPRQPVIFEPPGMGRPIVDREYDISPKALFHVLFGDKSVVWQLLYHERQARRIKQSSWSQPSSDTHLRREFEYEVDYYDTFNRNRHATVIDYQMIDVSNDHLCYVVTDRKSAWHLPFQQSLQLLSKIVITHVSKSKCRLAIFTAVDWTTKSYVAKLLVGRQALKDLKLDAEDLADVVNDQVRRLGAQSRTRKAVQIFGQIGQQTQQSELTSNDLSPTVRAQRRARRPTILALALDFAGSLVESIVTEALQLILNALTRTWSIVKAQHILLLLLASLIITNMMASSRVANRWWTDRRALNLLTSLESQSIPVVDQVIYAGDLDFLTSSEASLGQPPGTSGDHCLSTFHQIAKHDDEGNIDSARSDTAQQRLDRAIGQRLRMARHNLGAYRHDLLVALRVVNRIERETMEVEWSTWLLRESVRCRQLSVTIGEGAPASGTPLPSARWSNGTMEKARLLQKGYCRSCITAHASQSHRSLVQDVEQGH